MRNFLKLLAAAAVLAFGFGSVARAAVVTNTTDQLFNAVDEISTSLTVAAGTTLSIFVSGTYEDINTVVLQRELGSPGSGAWRNVQTVTSGVANARVTNVWVTGRSREAYRLLMTATGTGAVVAYLTDYAVSAKDYFRRGNADSIIFFDDFFGENNDGSLTAVNPSLWLATLGTDNQGTQGVITPGIHEGAVTIVSGGAEAGSSACLSFVDEATSGALVSDGTMVMEVRLRFSVTGLIAVMLMDENCTANSTADEFVDIDSGTTTQTNGGTDADVVAIVRQDEATDVDDWQAFSALAATMGANALEVPLGVATAVNTYVVLRVEIDSAGNAYFYVAGNLLHAEPLAVTTTARLIPLIIVAETVAGAGPVTGIIDYVLFVSPRPPT